MYAIAIHRFKLHKRISVYTIVVISCAILLTIADSLEAYAKAHGLLVLTYICSIFGYIVRPACIYFLILMAKGRFLEKFNYWTFIPLAINCTVYLLAFIPALKTVIVGFALNDQNTVSFIAGPLRFTGHVVSAFYLIYLLVASIASLNVKHLGSSIALILCTAFVTGAVVIETFFDNDNVINVLNPTIAICTLIYYLFLFNELSKVDNLTGLYNREAYYQDLLEMESTIKAVISFDMNNLKALNNEEGHMEGDKGIRTIASAIQKNIPSRMYAYRVNGDEFVVISNACLEEEVTYAIKKIKAALKQTQYSCSIGYAYRKNDEDISFKEMVVKAEKMLLEDKEEFHSNRK